MMLYLIKSSAVLLLIILFYKAFLEKEKAFVFNRIFLLGGLFVCLVSPLLTYTVSTEWAEFILPEKSFNYAYYAVVADSNASIENTSREFTWINLLFVLYSLGFIGMFIKFNKNLYTLINRCKKASYKNIDGYKVVTEAKDAIPFSFFHYIFLPQGAEKEILEHEKRHVDAYHSIDLILSEIFLIVFWFNPLFHWYRRLLTQNHEYYADASPKNKDLKKYKLLLFHQINKNKANTLASGFDYSIIKKRMIMLQKSRSGPLLWAKQILVIPFFAILLLAACEKVEAQEESGFQSEITNNVAKDKLQVELDGKMVNAVQFFYDNTDRPMTSDNMLAFLRKMPLTEMDKLHFRINNKDYKGSSLPEISYTQQKEELFMRQLDSSVGLLKIGTKEKANGWKKRAINLGDGQNRSTNYSGDTIPPPPPPPALPAPVSEDKSILPPPPPPPPAPIVSSNVKPAKAAKPEKAAKPVKAPKPEKAPKVAEAPLPPPPPPPAPPKSLEEVDKLIKQVENTLKNHDDGVKELSYKEIKWNKNLLQTLYEKRKEFE